MESIAKGEKKMKKLIAYCGLDCEKCDARNNIFSSEDVRS